MTCNRCAAAAAWQVFPPGDERTVETCAAHLQDTLSTIPRGVAFAVVGLS
jgi:hypothetical protein